MFGIMCTHQCLFNLSPKRSKRAIFKAFSTTENIDRIQCLGRLCVAAFEDEFE